MTDPTPSAVPSTPGAAGGRVIVWDNSNIAENYPGMTTPLTMSIIATAYAAVYRALLDLMGAKADSAASDLTLRTLLGFHDGRVYYQLQSWYAALAHLPAFGRNRPMMEQMMGVGEDAGANLTDPAQATPPPIVPWLLRMVWQKATFSRRKDAFIRNAERLIADFDSHRLAGEDEFALFGRFELLRRELLANWRTPLVGDLFVMIFSGALRRACLRWAPEDGSLYPSLLTGTEDSPSTRPVAAFMSLVEAARVEPGLVGALIGQEPGNVWAKLGASPDERAFLERVHAYLAVYGDRSPGELKLEVPSFKEAPEQLLAMIAANLRAASGTALNGSPASPAQVAEHGEALGNGNENQPPRDTPVAGLNNLSGPKRLALGFLARQARQHIAAREELRLTRAKVFGALRRLFVAIGKRWASVGMLDSADDIFYLTHQEVWDQVLGTAVTIDLAALVRLRRAEYAARAAGPAPPGHFVTRGVPYLDRRLQSSSAAGIPAMAAVDSRQGPDAVQPFEPGSRRVLRGTPCGGGRREGPARIVRDPRDAGDLAGAVLVAERTDPGWVFLFPACAAIVVAYGSALSHAAIVARELGKPTVVGLPGILGEVRDGDWLVVDGQTGEVLIGRHPESEAGNANG